jgi:hypothetical protein
MLQTMQRREPNTATKLVLHMSIHLRFMLNVCTSYLMSDLDPDRRVMWPELENKPVL